MWTVTLFALLIFFTWCPFYLPTSIAWTSAGMAALLGIIGVLTNLMPADAREAAWQPIAGAIRRGVVLIVALLLPILCTIIWQTVDLRAAPITMGGITYNKHTRVWIRRFGSDRSVRGEKLPARHIPNSVFPITVSENWFYSQPILLLQFSEEVSARIGADDKLLVIVPKDCEPIELVLSGEPTPQYGQAASAVHAPFWIGPANDAMIPNVLQPSLSPQNISHQLAQAVPIPNGLRPGEPLVVEIWQPTRTERARRQLYEVLCIVPDSAYDTAAVVTVTSEHQILE